jgi:transposase
VPKKFPPEFKRDVVRVARRGHLSHAEVAADFHISVKSVRRWVRQADIDDGVVEGQTSAEQSELVQLRREKRRLEMENEILRRAAVHSSGQRNTSRPVRRWGSGQVGAAGDVGSTAGAAVGDVGVGQVLPRGLPAAALRRARRSGSRPGRGPGASAVHSRSVLCVHSVRWQAPTPATTLSSPPRAPTSMKVSQCACEPPEACDPPMVIAWAWHATSWL